MDTITTETPSRAPFEHFGDRTVDDATFEQDITLIEWERRYRVGDLVHGPFIFSPSPTCRRPT